MKKLALITAIISALFFVGCSSNPALSFTNAWSDDAVGYYETLVYDVCYDEDYAFADYNFTKGVGDDVLDCNFYGTYTVTNKIISVNNESLPEEITNSEVITGLSKIVVTYSTLSITAEYAYGDKTETYNDYIYNACYFCSSDTAFAPIYSTTEFDYTMVKISNAVNVYRTKGLNQIKYNNSNYTVTNKSLDLETNEVIATNEKTFEYDSKTLIDNASFFLAVRNTPYKKDMASYLPTVHPSYGEAQTLQVTYFNDTEISGLNLIVNGESLENVSFGTEVIKYHVDSTNKSGTSQLMFIQNGATSNIPDKAFMVKYVSSISDYSSYSKLGSLVYTLNKIDYSK